VCRWRLRLRKVTPRGRPTGGRSDGKQRPHHTTLLFRVPIVVGLSLLTPIGWTADWPQWRADARRSGAIEETLADTLHLQWVRRLPAVACAWPNEPRLAFDAAYAPVVAGGRVLVSSAAEGSLTAYDLAGGEQRWKYFADGPIRFAPAVAAGRVFVGADDGWLHVVSLADGRPLGKIRGAPADRPDRRQLGNNRLVSLWPVRGGPVIVDKTVYFAAGIWPTMGISLVAVDAENLALRWRNDTLGHIEEVRLDHNALGPSGLSPQGYLAVEGDLLVVPNGRSLPAGVDRLTGRLRWYLQGYRNGDCKVALSTRYAFVGRTGVVDLRTGREVGSRWADAGSDAPQGFDAKKFHLFEGPFHPYKQFAGCSARSVLCDSWAYDFEGAQFTARDLAQAAVTEWASKFKGGAIKPWRWDPPLAWSLKSGPSVRGTPEVTLLRAGCRLYGHAAGKLTAAELGDDPAVAPRIAWQQNVAGTPAELLAADGRLLVVTREGQLSCFGPQATKPKTFELPSVEPLSPASNAWNTRADEILRAAQANQGHCVLLGLGTGQLVERLLTRSQLKMVVVEPDRFKADQARQRLIAAGLYPARVEIVVGAIDALRLPPYLAHLIVAEEPWNTIDPTQRRLFDVVHPYGGSIATSMNDAVFAALAQQAAGHRDRFETRRVGQLGVFRRVGAPQGSADWTHESADAARSHYSHDRLVRPPLAMLWYGDGPDYGFWKEKDYGSGVKPQVVGGRVFALRITANTLFAYDAYTGHMIWQTPVSPFARYVSRDDGIYVAGDGRVTVYTPATGQMRAVWPFEIAPGQPALVSDIRVGDQVVIAAAPHKSQSIARGLWDSSTLIALDRSNGRLLWKRQARDRFNNHALSLGSDLVFCVDSPSPMLVDQQKRRGQSPSTALSTLLALDARTGAMRWSHTAELPYRNYDADSWLGALGNDDWTAYAAPLKLLLAGKQGTARAYEAATGRLVWESRVGSQPLILREDSFLSQTGEPFDLRTGKSLGVRFRLTRGGCNYAVAGEHLLLVRDRSVSYVDLETGSKQSLYAIRSGCSNSLIAADGLLNVPNFAVQCVCNYPIQTTFAMIHLPEAAAWLPADTTGR